MVGRIVPGHGQLQEPDMIKIKNLQMNMDGKDVLKGIDLHLNPGDVYGLLGSKGAGKTTIIYVLLRFARLFKWLGKGFRM